MSKKRTRGNPNFGRKDNAPTPVVKNSTPIVNTCLHAIRIPTLATAIATTLVSSNPEVTLPTPLANVTIPRSSNLLSAPMEVAKREEFGRDKDLKIVLKHL